MNLLSSVFFISISIFFITIIRINHKKLSYILTYAFIIKIFLLIINNNIFFIVDGNMDALSFEKKGWEYGGYLDTFSFISNLYEFGFNKTYSYSYFIALIYSFFGRNIIIIQSLSILISLMSIYLTYLVSLKLFNNDKNISLLNAFLCASLISIVNYSVLSMREAYILFILLLSINLFFNYLELNKIIYFIGCLILSLLHYFLHPPMMSIIIVYTVIYFFVKMKKFNIKLKLILILLFLLLLIIINQFVNILIYIPYINEFPFDNLTLDQMLYYFKTTWSYKQRGLASFPTFLIPENTIELITLLPLRVAYFLGSPFIWELKNFEHIIAFLDSHLIIIALIILIIKFRFIKNKNLKWVTIFFILLTYIFIYSLGTGNFGTAFRHKSKFIILLYVLISPILLNYLKNLRK